MIIENSNLLKVIELLSNDTEIVYEYRDSVGWNSGVFRTGFFIVRGGLVKSGNLNMPLPNRQDINLIVDSVCGGRW